MISNNSVTMCGAIENFDGSIWFLVFVFTFSPQCIQVASQGELYRQFAPCCFLLLWFAIGYFYRYPPWHPVILVALEQKYRHRVVLKSVEIFTSLMGKPLFSYTCIARHSIGPATKWGIAFSWGTKTAYNGIKYTGVQIQVRVAHGLQTLISSEIKIGVHPDFPVGIKTTGLLGR